MTTDRTSAGFKQRTRLAEARERFLATIQRHGRTERLPLADADGRAVAGTVTASRAVPGYDRAAADGWAVRAADTFGASGRSPAVLRTTGESVGAKEAVRVHTGTTLPDGADAVVTAEETERLGPELEVFDAVAEGENVGRTGEDVTAGQSLHGPPHRLRPSDLGLLKSVGVDTVEVFERPGIAVVPTGDGLVETDPEPGQAVETNGLTVSRLAERWGADATRREAVAADEDAVRAAIERDLDHDVVVTTGGTSVDERDVVPAVVADRGEVPVHGVAMNPGRSAALGVVEGTPVLVLPGPPVACIVAAVQLLRPVLKHVGGLPASTLPTRHVPLTRKITSEPGVRTFARVELTGSSEGTGTGLTAEPMRASGADVLSSVALADGWAVVPESREGIDAGEAVDVELWEVDE